MTPPRSTADAAAPLRPPEGEVGKVIAWLQHEYDECMEEGLLEEEPDEIRAYVENVRAALTHLRWLAVVEVELRTVMQTLNSYFAITAAEAQGGPPREPTQAMIDAIHAIHRPGWAVSWWKVWTTMYDAWAKSQALAPAPAAEGE